MLSIWALRKAPTSQRAVFCFVSEPPRLLRERAPTLSTWNQQPARAISPGSVMFPIMPMSVSPLLPCKPPGLECSSALLEPYTELGSFRPPASGGGRRMVKRQHCATLPAWVLLLRLTELRVSSRFESQPIRKSTTGKKKKNTIACAKPKIA